MLSKKEERQITFDIHYLYVDMFRGDKQYQKWPRDVELHWKVLFIFVIVFLVHFILLGEEGKRRKQIFGI